MATVPRTESRVAPPPLSANALLLAEELSEIAERAQCLTGATGVVIALRRRNDLVIRTSDGIAPEVGATIPFPSGVTGLCVTTKKVQTCADPDAEAQLEGAFRALRVRSIMSVPVPWGGEVRAVLAVLSQAQKAFSASHIAILMALRDVLASKLSESEPAEPLRSSATESPLEIDLTSLLQEPEPVRVPPVAPSPKPAAPKPVSELVKEQEQPAPTSVSPDVLGFAEDPTSHGSLVKPKPAATYTARPATSPVAVPHPSHVANRAPQTWSRRNVFLLAGPVAALVLLGLGLVLYVRHRTAPAAPPAPENVAAHQAPAPAVPAPAATDEPIPATPAPQPPAPTPVTASPQPAASPVVAKTEGPKPEPAHTHAPEKAEEPVAVLQLSTGKPVAKPEEPVEPPSLGLTAGSVRPLPDLPAAAAPAAALVAKESLAVPATRLQGRPPEYPAQAKLLRRSGVVRLHIAISAEGKVTDARVISGDPYLVAASVRAVREWTYRPATLNGRPVSSSTDVAIQFKGE
ncbi:MAG TPA: TonB family protein [Terriglobales bacterium]|nr:TonB family protein [Terriglobales bacterium]